MERFFLILEDETTVTLLDQVYANDADEAQNHFDSQGWVIGNVTSEYEWNEELDH